jgi:hypothetical protein
MEVSVKTALLKLLHHNAVLVTTKINVLSVEVDFILMTQVEHQNAKNVVKN